MKASTMPHDSASRAMAAMRRAVTERTVTPDATSEGEKSGRGSVRPPRPNVLGAPARAHPILPRMTEGHVIVIGGAEDKVRERVILSRFVKLAGGEDARVAVISTASSLGPLAGEMYRRVFGELGVSHVDPIHTTT